MWARFKVAAARFQNSSEGSTRRFKNDEDGSLVVFTLFLLILVLMIAGTAIDAMRHETRRVALQNTLDSAILAAASLNQSIDAETLIKDHVTKAGMNPDKVTVQAPDETLSNGDTGDLIARRLVVEAQVDTPTMFMSMMGINDLGSTMGSAAEEQILNVEIVIVVDISGSMGWNSKMDNLKIAAKDFAQHVLTVGPNASRTSISIVPYNAVVVAGNDIVSRLPGAAPVSIPVDVPVLSPVGLSNVWSDHTNNTCIRFYDDDFDDIAITQSTPLERVAQFSRWGLGMDNPEASERWCNENRSAILTHETNYSTIETHINNLSTGGNTSIDDGMKWAAALLDPEFRPVVNDMVDDGILSASVQDRPGAYDQDLTKKIIVLMTDGKNTTQRDLKAPFKRGPSRIWFSDLSWKDSDGNAINDPDLGRNLTRWDGYFVFMPDNDTTTQFYRPGSPWTTADDRFYSLADMLLFLDIEQKDYLYIYENYSVPDAAAYFFENSGDTAAYNAHANAVDNHDNGAQGDARLADICAEVNDTTITGGSLTVYAIGFEAPPEGLAAMRDCATGEGDANYYDVSGREGIVSAFDSIANQITQLRLTN